MGYDGSVIIVAAIATGTLLFRGWSRVIHKEPLWLDDAAVIVGWLCAFGPLLNVIVYNNLVEYHEDPNTSPDVLKKVTDRFNILNYAFYILYGLGSGFLKLAILSFYWRLFRSIKWMKRCITVVAALVIAWSLASALTWMAQCRPISAAWRTDIKGSCINFFPFAVVVQLFNFLFDLVILILPLPVVLGLKTAIAKKVSLCFAFGLGAFVCTISAVRFNWVIHEPSNDSNNHGNELVLFWTAAESYTAIICADLPFVYSVGLYYLPKTVRKLFKNGYSSQGRTSEANGTSRAGGTRSHRNATEMSSNLKASRRDMHDDENGLLAGRQLRDGKDNGLVITTDFVVREEEREEELEERPTR